MAGGGSEGGGEREAGGLHAASAQTQARPVAGAPRVEGSTGRAVSFLSRRDMLMSPCLFLPLSSWLLPPTPLPLSPPLSACARVPKPPPPLQVESGFFTKVRFFRVLAGFMAQFGISGDPAVAGTCRTRALHPELSPKPQTLHLHPAPEAQIPESGCSRQAVRLALHPSSQPLHPPYTLSPES